MRVLVTGSAGYLGFPVVAEMRAAGHDVSTLDTGFFRDSILAEVFAPDVVADVRDLTPHLFTGYEAVIHLAELSNDPMGEMDPSLTVDINEGGTAKVAELAKQASVERFVYFSSCSIYGASSGEPVDELGAPNPLTAYARAKLANEQALGTLADASFAPVMMRNATAFGPSPALRLDLVVNEFTFDAVTTGKVVMRSAGTAWRPFAHVDDIARVARLLLDQPLARIRGEIINVGSDASTRTVREVAEVVARLTGSEIVIEDDTVDARDYRVSFQKLRDLLGPDAVTRTIDDGVRQLMELLNSNQAAIDRIGKDGLKRLPTLRNLLSDGSLSPKLRWQQSQ